MPEHADVTSVQRFIDGIEYPVSRRSLIEGARQQGADEAALALLARLPDETYRDRVSLEADLHRIAGGHA